jgi:hypothetical protein
MWKGLPFVLLVLLSGCAEPASEPKPVGPPVQLVRGCPSIPSESGLTISGRMGADFWVCEARDPLGQVMLNIYLGNHPDTPPSLRYAGSTTHGKVALVWFTSAAAGDNRWYTFVPTGDRVMPVMAIWFSLPPSGDPRQMAALVAQLSLRREDAP